MVAILKLHENEHRCDFTESEHQLHFNGMCPITGNPQPGSYLIIHYKPNGHFLEVVSLRGFIDSYQGGKGEVRSMEAMLQEITQACSDILAVDVKLTSHLVIKPTQIMRITCYAFPKPTRK